jgi:hypothetical protein
MWRRLLQGPLPIFRPSAGIVAVARLSCGPLTHSGLFFVLGPTLEPSLPPRRLHSRAHDTIQSWKDWTCRNVNPSTKLCSIFAIDCVFATAERSAIASAISHLPRFRAGRLRVSVVHAIDPACLRTRLRWYLQVPAALAPRARQPCAPNREMERSLNTHHRPGRPNLHHARQFHRLFWSCSAPLANTPFQLR